MGRLIYLTIFGDIERFRDSLNNISKKYTSGKYEEVNFWTCEPFPDKLETHNTIKVRDNLENGMAIYQAGLEISEITETFKVFITDEYNKIFPCTLILKNGKVVDMPNYEPANKKSRPPKSLMTEYTKKIKNGQIN